MLILYLTEIVLLLIATVVVVTQIIFPIMNKRPIFPIFRKNLAGEERLANETLDQYNDRMRIQETLKKCCSSPNQSND